MSVSGRGLSLLFNVNQVLNFLKPSQGLKQTRMECTGDSKDLSEYFALSDRSHKLDIVSFFVNLA